MFCSSLFSACGQVFGKFFCNCFPRTTINIYGNNAEMSKDQKEITLATVTGDRQEDPLKLPDAVKKYLSKEDEKTEPIQPFKRFRKVQTDNGEGTGSSRVDFSDKTAFLFDLLKREENPNVLIHTYQFTTEMTSEIRKLFESSAFRSDFKKGNLTICSNETVSRLDEFGKRYSNVLAAAMNKV